MTSYLVDTNILSELRKLTRANDGARKWAASVLEDENHISVISLMEIERGVLKIAAKDQTQAAVLRSWLDNEVRPTFSSRTLPVTADIALRAATFPRHRPVELADELIAATALVHGLTLVTHNTRHFTHTGVPLFDPFT